MICAIKHIKSQKQYNKFYSRGKGGSLFCSLTTVTELESINRGKYRNRENYSLFLGSHYAQRGMHEKRNTKEVGRVIQ